MASVGKLLKQISSIQNEWNNISINVSDQCTTSDLHILQALSQQLQQLRDSLHSMQSKFGQMDPISGGE